MRGAWGGAGLALALLASFLLDAASARADRADLPARLAGPDPTDGRIEGDLDAVVGLGAVVTSPSVRGTLDLRLRFVDTAGVFFTYEDGFGDDGASRAVATGVELRPLFLARWLTGNELGVAWPDLAIDSFGLELGACLQQLPGRPIDSQPALQAGLGLELPLFARASGLWLGFHGGGRWSDTLQGGGQAGGPTLFLSVTLAWHQVLRTHLVDLHDRAP